MLLGDNWEIFINLKVSTRVDLALGATLVEGLIRKFRLRQAKPQSGNFWGIQVKNTVVAKIMVR